MLRIEWIVAATLLVACAPSESALVAANEEPVSAEEARVTSGPHAVMPGGELIELEVARSDEQRARGLMFRESLPQGHGMLFIFQESDLHGFWMKNTFISLDMIWLAEDGTIADIARDVPPCNSDPCPSYVPDAPGAYVIELAAGESQRLGLEDGQIIELRNIDPPPNG